MREQERPYRYQYSYAANRQQRMRTPNTPKKKRGGRILWILVVLLVLGTVGWLALKPDASIKTAADTVKEAVKKEPEPPKPTLDKTLESKLAAWVAEQDGEYGITVREVNNDMRFAHFQATKSFVPASTFKPFVAYTILHNVEQGQYTLQRKTYKGNTIEYCLERMITVSDNQCAYELERLAGFEEMDTFIHEQGFTATNLDNYDANGRMLATDKASTSADLAQLMWRLQNGTLLNKEHTGLLLSLMKDQEWRERIPAGIPDGVEVADKPGWLPGIEADMGIVYGTKSTYIITILSSGNTRPSNLADLSRLIYNYLNPVDASTRETN